MLLIIVKSLHKAKKIFLLQCDLHLIRRSGLFDKAFYLKNNPDVLELAVNPMRHFLLYGGLEGRDPGPGFSSRSYLDTNPDVRKAKANPLLHYLKYGIKEGRSITALEADITKYGYMSVVTAGQSPPAGPDLIIIGEQKAGTTSLFHFLDNRPDFCGSQTKEVHFFDRDGAISQGIDWYHANFGSCRKGKIIFEATPNYLYYTFSHGRILKYCQTIGRKIKFIVMLREPASRALSHWNMYRIFNKRSATNIYNDFVQYANEDIRNAVKELLFTKNFPSFEQCIQQDMKRFDQGDTSFEPSFVRRGVYIRQVDHWLKYFDVEHTLFIEMGELGDPKSILQKISRFLSVEVDDEDLSGMISIQNKGSYEETDRRFSRTLSQLKEFYYPFNEELFKRIGKRYDWNDS